MIVDRPSFNLGLGLIQEDVAYLAPSVALVKTQEANRQESPLKLH